MNELTRQCLALSMEDKEDLIRVLNASIIDEIEDDGRFRVLLKIATEIVGDGILTRSRDYNCVMGRKIAGPWQRAGYLRRKKISCPVAIQWQRSKIRRQDCTGSTGHCGHG